MWGSRRYNRPQRKRETSKVEIPEFIENEFAVVLWYYNERLHRDEGFINHYLYGDIHFWKSALSSNSDTSNLKENVPVIFSGHRKNEKIVVDKLTLAKPSDLDKEMIERLIELVFGEWKHSYYWKTICISAISDNLGISEQTDLFINLINKHEQNNTCNEGTLTSLMSFFTNLDHSKLAPIFKKYFSEYKYYLYAIKNNLHLDEQSSYEAIGYVLLNGKYESGISDLLLALQQHRYGFQTKTILNILKQLHTEDQFYKAVHLDLYNSGFSWNIIQTDARTRIKVSNLESFNKWYQAQMNFEFPNHGYIMDSASKESRVLNYIKNFSLEIDFNNWAEALSLGFSFFTLIVDDILQHCKTSSEADLWEKVKKICDSAIDKTCLDSIKDTILCLARFVTPDTLHLWRFIHTCSICLQNDYSDVAIVAFENITNLDAKASIWAIYHDYRFHDGFGTKDVLASLRNLSKENQCRVFNRLLAEAKTMEEVKHICHLKEITSLGNISIEQFKLFLNYINEYKADAEINKSVISNAYIRLLIHSEGIAELEYYLPLCNFRNIPADVMVSKHDDNIAITFEGEHHVHKGLFGYSDNVSYNYTGNAQTGNSLVFCNVPLVNQDTQNNLSIDTPVFCEGRLVTNKKTKKQPSLSKEYNIPYYWCYNKKCIFPTMEYADGIEHNYKYSSSFEATASYKFGFLNILKLWGASFNSSMMANIVSASMNSAKRLFEHLKCRECGVYMIPAKTSNYAYYQSHIYKCETCGAEVYLSHCLNPNCTDIIDSRDCSKCPNGWFICKSCLACCNDEKIEIRTQIRKDTGQSEVKMIGHRGKHIFCPKCGQQLDGTINRDPEKQRKITDYLEKSDRELVRSKGIRNGHWYLVNLKVYTGRLKYEISIEELARRFALSGLSVKKADIATPEKPWYFVSDTPNQGDLYAGAFTLNDIKTTSNIICNCGYSMKVTFALAFYHNREKKE